MSRRIPSWSISGTALIVIGAICVAAAFGGVWYFNRRASQFVSVVVAAQAVPPLSPILPGDLTLAKRPKDSLPKHGVYHTVPPLLYQFTETGFVPGEVVRNGMFLPPPSGAASTYDLSLTHTSAQLNESLRAVPLPLGVANGFTLPQPGDHVDLFAVISASKSGNTSSSSGGGSVVTPIVQHALVLSVIAPGAASPAPSGPLGTGNKSVASQQTQASSGVLLLALTPLQSERVVLAEVTGSITAVLDPLSGACAKASTSAADASSSSASASGVSATSAGPSGCPAQPEVRDMPTSTLTGNTGGTGSAIAILPSSAGIFPGTGSGGNG